MANTVSIDSTYEETLARVNLLWNCNMTWESRRLGPEETVVIAEVSKMNE